VPEDSFVLFVPRHSLLPDEPYRLTRDSNGSFSISVAEGTPITRDFVQLLTDVIERRLSASRDDSGSPPNIPFPRGHREWLPLP
jgi:hypothetical protein